MTSFRTIAIQNCFLILCAALWVPSRAAAQEAKPLQIADAVKILQLSNRTPLSLSPDGVWAAYTVEDDSKHDSTKDPRYMFYTPTGAFTEALGCDVWLSNTKTKESKNVTGGKGTSWAPVWSPDGKYLAFFSDRSGTAHLWVWEKSTGQMRQVSDVIVRPFFNFQVAKWTSDSQKILVKALQEGKTVEQAADMLYGPKKKNEPEKKVDPNAPTVNVLSFVPAPPGEKPAEEKKSTGEFWMDRYIGDLALVDVKTGKAERIVKDVRPLGYWLSPDNSMIAYTHFAGSKENTQQIYYELKVVKIADKTSRMIVPQLMQDYGISVSWSPDSRSLAYTTEGQLAKGDCYVVGLDGGEPQLLTAGDHPPFGDDHRAPLWDAAGENVYLISAENYGVLGTPNVWKASVKDRKFSRVGTLPGHVVLEIISPTAGGRFWSPDDGKSLVIAARNSDTKEVGFFRMNLTNGQTTKLREEKSYFGRDPIFNMDVSHDGKTVVFVEEDSQHPEDIWAAGPDFGDARRVSSINKNIEGLAFGASRVIDYYSVDGEALHGALLLPANYGEGKKYPMVVDPYGGSYRSETVFRFGLSGAGVENLQILATRGYAALLPDTPMHGNSPMSDLAKTVIPAVDRVVEMGIADPQRLGIMGHSYGGYSTLSVIVQTTRFKAAVDSAGPADLISDYGITDDKGGSGAIGWAETGQGRMGGTPWQYRDRYIENSPIFFLDRIQTPVLIIQGALDQTVPHQQAEEVFVGLRRLGKEVTYANYAGEEHWEGTWGLANAVDYWNRVIAWFDHHMPVVKASTTAMK
jgi:dipeptidyl aminopeptidase/acylaminoacyl peptidase